MASAFGDGLADLGFRHKFDDKKIEMILVPTGDDKSNTEKKENEL